MMLLMMLVMMLVIMLAMLLLLILQCCTVDSCDRSGDLGGTAGYGPL